MVGLRGQPLVTGARALIFPVMFGDVVVRRATSGRYSTVHKLESAADGGGPTGSVVIGSLAQRVHVRVGGVQTTQAEPLATKQGRAAVASQRWPPLFAPGVLQAGQRCGSAGGLARCVCSCFFSCPSAKLKTSGDTQQ
jgi:hypothetical protein